MSNEVAKVNAGKLPINKVSGDTLLNMVVKVLGDKKVANKVVSSLMACTSANPTLRECETASLISCALMANELKLSMAQGLGFCAMVPFNDTHEGIKKAQFQVMCKGYIQLAIRSGNYINLDAKPIYEGQLAGKDEFGNEIFDFFAEEKGEPVGYYAYFVLTNGFKKTLYMSKEKVLKHAIRYSKAFNNDRKYKKQSSLWSTDFDVMAEKTVLKQLLSHFGLLSIELEHALSYDQAIGKNGDGSYDYSDANTQGVFEEEPKEIANRKETSVKNTLATEDEPVKETVQGTLEETAEQSTIDDDELPWEK